jgi:biotin carboxylase
MTAPARTPVILLDSIGYLSYRNQAGHRFLPADRYAVRLVTDVRRVAEAEGEELESVIGVPKYDERAVADSVRFQAGLRGVRATRLVSVTERLLLPAARLREELGIPGPSVAQTLLFRDKVAMKQHLRDNGIMVPDFAPFSEHAARELLRAHGQLIAKPTLGAGAVDIFVLGSDDAIAAFAREQEARLGDFEVEQFISGQLCHVDSIVRDGTVVAATGARYLDDTRSYLDGKPCRDVGLAPGPLLDSLLEFNQRALRCYPGFTGTTHHEMFVTSSGICFCEIACRAGGGGVIAGFLSRTGVNLDHAVLQAQVTDSLPPYGEVAHHLTGWVVLYSRAGVLAEPVQVPERPWIIEAQILARPGDALTGPVNCNSAIAIVSVRGETEEEVTRRLNEVIRCVAPRIEPAARAEGSTDHAVGVNIGT